MTYDPAIFSLHKYYLQANRMRVGFDQALNQGEIDWESELQIDRQLYMNLWYGSLYVVVEGWNDLKLTDPNVDELLKSPFVDLLKRYRNGAFHFQKNYYDERFANFMKEPDTPRWVRTLHGELGRFFLQWLGQQKRETE